MWPAAPAVTSAPSIGTRAVPRRSRTESCTYNMNYAEIKKNDIANGEGVRTSLFVSGCRNRCKNCFNAVTWDFLYGKPFDQAVEDDIIASTRPRWISGLSLLGGEPFEPENQAPLLAFLRRFRTALPGKTVWCYTGFTLEELLGKSGECRACTPHTRELLGLIDILVDGRYEEELADITLAFRGFKNQRVLNLPATLTTGDPVLYLE